MTIIDRLERLYHDRGKAVDKAFEYILYNSATFEDLMEDVMVDMYERGLRAPDLEPAMLKPVIDGLDADDVADAIGRGGELFVDSSEVRDALAAEEMYPLLYDYVQDLYYLILQEHNEAAEPDVTDARTLVDRDDAAGDKLTTGQGFTVDDPVRDYPFVVYDNQWLNWNNELGLSAHHLILETLEGVTSRSTNLRDLRNAEGIDPTKPVIFADKIGDVGFIEAYENISLEDAVAVIKERFTKVYRYDQPSSVVYRLARWRR